MPALWKEHQRVGTEAETPDRSGVVGCADPLGCQGIQQAAGEVEGCQMTIADFKRALNEATDHGQVTEPKAWRVNDLLFAEDGIGPGDILMWDPNKRELSLSRWMRLDPGYCPGNMS